MASHYIVERAIQEGQIIQELAFAGDNVRLSGQIDYPDAVDAVTHSYPLLFILHNSGWHTREHYNHFAQLALQSGYAVFRWDKRGTGRSGAGGIGSTTQDALCAYETAINQIRINSKQVVILAQGEGTLLLGNNFNKFKKIQHPAGVVLAGNMLDSDEITSIDAPIHVVMGRNDWNDWKIYAKEACTAHDSSHKLNASYYVATNANRLLIMGNETCHSMIHVGAQNSIQNWLGIVKAI